MIAAVLMIVGVGVRSFADANRDAEALRQVTHTHEVLETLQAMLNGLGAAESALRGFALSDDPATLTDVAPAMAQTTTSLATTAVLVLDNADQTQRVSALKPLVQQRLSIMSERLRRIRAGERPGYSNEAQALTERIRHEVNEMIAIERALLMARRETSERLTLTTMWTLPIASVVAVVLLIVLFGFLSSEMAFRRRSEQAVRRRLDEMRLLGRMNEMLASCRQVAEAYDVLGRLAPGLFQGVSGAISIFRPSRDLIERQAFWGEHPPAALFAPDDCWCLRRGQPHRSGSAHDVSCAHFGADMKQAALCVPLLAHGEVIGTLQLIGPIDDDTGRVATVVAENVALAIANLQLRETLRNQSLRDPLTGLFNRRYTEETFVRELGRAARAKEPVSLLMLDVDHFKRFNDTFGHDAGDLVLKEIAAVLVQQTRGSDVVARLGGEELCVLLPGASTDDAFKRAEEIRKAIAALELKHHGNTLGRVTTSIGLSTVPQHAKTVDDMMRSADAALYRAKHEGRDRVVIA